MLGLARRRREVVTRREVFVDLLSWRFARADGIALARSRLRALRKDENDMVHEPRAVFRALVGHMEQHVSGTVRPTALQLGAQLETTFSTRTSVGEGAATTASPVPAVVEARQREERQFLHKVGEMLMKGRYHLASRNDWDYSRTHSYRTSAPVAVRWKRFDKEMLEPVAARLYSDPRMWTCGADPQGRLEMPREARRALVFHRGVGMDRTTSFFIGEKSDEAIRRGALLAYRKLLAALNRTGERLRRKVQRMGEAGIERSATLVGAAKASAAKWPARLAETVVAKVFFALQRLVSERISTLQLPSAGVDLDVSIALPKDITQVSFPRGFKVPPAVSEAVIGPVPKANEAPSAAPEPDAPVVLETRDKALEQAVEARIAMTDHKLSLGSLISRITLQEPTYRDVVVMYRLADPPVTSTVSQREAITFKRAGVDSHGRKGNPRGIAVKCFRDVPMSDLELLLPEKQVSLSVSNRVNYGLLALMGGTALFNVVVVLLPGSGQTLSTAWLAAAIASGAYFSRVAFRMYMSWEYYTTLTHAFMADNICATGPAAVSLVAQEATEQTVKEMAVTYLALVELSRRAGEAIPFADLSEQCQLILHKTYSHDVQVFDARDASEALAEAGLVELLPDDAVALQVSGADDDDGGAGGVDGNEIGRQWSYPKP